MRTLEQAPIAQETPALRPLPAPSRPPARRRSGLRRAFGMLLKITLLLALIAALGVFVAPRVWPAPPLPTQTAAEPTAPKLTARGQVRPVRQARVGALDGGTVTRVSVEVGDVVEEKQELARIEGPHGTEVLTAPWRGTVIGMPVRHGDTVTAGTVMAYIGDLSRLQVETTDVDEFLIAQVQRGQAVTATVDALERSELRGYVRTVALQIEKNDSGDDHYPVVIDVLGPTEHLRPGMTVRVRFEPEAP